MKLFPCLNFKGEYENKARMSSVYNLKYCSQSCTKDKSIIMNK